MVDTVRTLAALQALLADNDTDDISPQDVRDFLVSVYPTKAAVQAKRTTSQAISSGGFVAVEFTAENFDTDAFHDNATNPERFTIPAGLDGVYFVQPKVAWGSTSIFRRVLALNKNTSAASGELTRIDDDDGEMNAQTVSVMVELAEGDWVQAQVFHDFGSDVNLNASYDLQTAMTMYRVIPIVP